MSKPAQPKNRQVSNETPPQSGDNTESDGGTQQQCGTDTTRVGQQAVQPIFKDWASI